MWVFIFILSLASQMLGISLDMGMGTYEMEFGSNS